MWFKKLFGGSAPLPPVPPAPPRSLPARRIPGEYIFGSHDELTDAEIRCFKTHGVLVKTGILPEPDRRRAVDRCWELLPSNFLRDQPETWSGMVKDCCHEMTLRDRLGRVKFRECLRGETWVYDILARNPVLQRVVTQLLGEVSLPSHIRGLYPVFPVGIPEDRPPKPHTDMQIFQVGTVGYLEGVALHGGGFTVWPGSHLRLFQKFAINGTVHPAGPEVKAEMELARTEIQPWEICGPAGMVIFWHHRLMHTYGYNRTEQVRQAILGDFARTNPWEPAPFKESDDPWAGWSERIREA